MRIGVGGGGRIVRGGASIGRGGVRAGVGVGPFSVRGGGGGRRRGSGSDDDWVLPLLAFLMGVVLLLVVAFFAAGALVLMGTATYFALGWRRKPSTPAAVGAVMLALVAVGSFLLLASRWRNDDYMPFRSCSSGCSEVERDAASATAYRWQVRTTAAAAVLFVPVVGTIVVMEGRSRKRAETVPVPASRPDATGATGQARPNLRPTSPRSAPLRPASSAGDGSRESSDVVLLVTYSTMDPPSPDWWSTPGTQVGYGLEDGEGHVGAHVTGVGDAFRLFRCTPQGAYDALHRVNDVIGAQAVVIAEDEAESLRRLWCADGAPEYSLRWVHLLVSHVSDLSIAEDVWSTAGEEVARGFADAHGRAGGCFVGERSVWRLMRCTPDVAFDAAHRLGGEELALVVVVSDDAVRRLMSLPRILPPDPARPATVRPAGTTRPGTAMSAEEQLALTTDPVRRHFLYNDIEQRLYRARAADPEALARFDEVCAAHHEEMELIVPALVARVGSGLPLLPLYRQQCIRQRKAGDLDAGLLWAQRGIDTYRLVAGPNPHADDLVRRADWFRSRCSGRASRGGRESVVPTEFEPSPE